MGVTDYGNEAPSNGIFGAAAEGSKGERGSHWGSLRGHPSSETVMCGDLCTQSFFFPSSPA